MSAKIPLTVALLLAVETVANAAPPDAAIEYFEKNVRPILVENCYTCHSADTNSKGGLRVDDRGGLIQGGNTGPAVVVGDPENSLLISAVKYTEDALKMPPKKRLTEEQVAVLTQWIKEGAAWPPARVAASVGKTNANYEKLRKEHWAWQPLHNSSPPEVRRQFVAALRDRSLHTRRARGQEPETHGRRGQAHPHPARFLRPHRPAPHSRSDRSICE